MTDSGSNQNRPPLGAHTSISGGVFNAVLHGKEIGADVVQIFSKNQMQWKGRDYTEKELEKFFSAVKETGVRPVMIHCSYLINLASPKKETLRRSIEAFVDELQRAEKLKVPYVVIHPGSHVGEGEAAGIQTVAASLRECFERAATSQVTALLETTAGQGTNLGYRFEQLRDMIEQADLDGKIGVCLDTCHVFAAGYDIRTPAAWEATRREFDSVIGLGALKGLHLNDSLKELGSRRDRHQRIGDGEIGAAGFAAILNDPQMHNLPMVLEVPGGQGAYRDDLIILKGLLRKE